MIVKFLDQEQDEQADSDMEQLEECSSTEQTTTATTTQIGDCQIDQSTLPTDIDTSVDSEPLSLVKSEKSPETSSQVVAPPTTNPISTNSLNYTLPLTERDYVALKLLESINRYSKDKTLDDDEDSVALITSEVNELKLSPSQVSVYRLVST